MLAKKYVILDRNNRFWRKGHGWVRSLGHATKYDKYEVHDTYLNMSHAKEYLSVSEVRRLGYTKAPKKIKIVKRHVRRRRRTRR